MADYALSFDGIQSYLNLGTMGNFGSNLGSGFYCSFDIKTTSTSQGEFGIFNNSDLEALRVGFNESNTGNLSVNGLNVLLRDKNNNALQANIGTPTITWNDGNKHTIIITANGSTNTITLSIDGTSQTMAYSQQQTPATFSNFQFAFVIGARNIRGTINMFFVCTLDNFQIGTSSSTLYGNYGFNEGSGTTTADSSGNGNTGTLTGSPLPTWVTGLNAYGNVTGNFTFNGNLSLSGNL